MEIADEMHQELVCDDSDQIKNDSSHLIVPRQSAGYAFVKRFADILFSSIGLLLLSPFLLIIAILIRVEDGGKAIYKQERRGLNGKPFLMYKFRSMCENAEEFRKNLLNQNEADGPIFKMANDPRITKIGAFIRRTSIDELPQLWNILKGDMSIVGPRPLPVYEADACTDYQKQRLKVKPGLTCYWQISGRSNTTFEQMIQLDFQYMQERSVFIDIKIILKTVVTVFKHEGAY